jgi:hypothetical protein
MSIASCILASIFLAAGFATPTLAKEKQKVDFKFCVVQKESQTEAESKFVSELAKKLEERFTVVHVGTMGKNESIRGCDGDDFYVSLLGVEVKQFRSGVWSESTGNRTSVGGIPREIPYAGGLLRIPKIGVEREFRSHGKGIILTTQKGAIKNLADDVRDWVDKNEENLRDALAKEKDVRQK